MNFMKNRIDRPVDPLPPPQVFRHIDLRPSTSRATSKSIHDTLNETVAANEPYPICAVAEGRGHATLEIGLAGIDITAPVLQMSQFSDNFWYSNILSSLQVLNPIVVFFSDHSLNTRASSLPDLIRKILPNVQILGLPRSFFNESFALKHMESLCCSTFRTLKDTLRAKYYGLAAVGALVRHCFESDLLRIAPRSLQFRYLSKSLTMAIDVECIGHLELMYSLHKTNDNHSLYRLMNHCITSVGKRHLRANLLEPSCSLEVLETRLTCVDELLTKNDLLCGIQRILRDLVDIGGLMRLAMDVDSLKTTKQNTIHVLNQANTLRNALRSVPELGTLLEDVQCSILKEAKQTLGNEIYKQLHDQICTVLDVETSSTHTSDYHRLFLVKSKVSSTLDVLRSLYSEVIDEIREYVANLTQEFRMLLKMTYTKTMGFHMQITLKDAGLTIPRAFKVLSRSGQRYCLTTCPLQAYNERINGIVKEIEMVSFTVIKQLIEDMREHIESIYALVANVTDLDVLQSLTVVSQDKEFCRPTFGRSTKIVAARHPLLEAYGEIEKVVKNNIIATPEFNVFIVTGPNMSGKTVYMKTISLLQIMAQLGCYVPAARAVFRIADRLMAVFGAAESIEHDHSNSSRMSRKLETIAHSLTVNSLVVIDELFGDTPSPDPSGPRWQLLQRIVGFVGFQPGASCQSLAAIQRPFVFLTTHCHDMLRPLERMHNVSRLCLQTEVLDVDGFERLRYKYTVAEGKTNVKNYGISLARCVRIPETVISRAEQINEELKNRTIGGRFSHNTTTFNGSFSTQANLQHFDKRLYDLYAQLALLLSESNEDNPEAIGSNLNGLLEKFVATLPEDVVQYLKETPLESLLAMNDQNFNLQQDLTMPSVSEGIAGQSEAAATDGSEPFEIDETIVIEEESQEL
ncbi:mutS protein homolog 4-like [Armigeres subalbatus]|uniref:mutS protein homolog 4-like n=1 Tax=Armigeres subalbatus TaxID=124917 RepID=UPI002ED27152